MIKIIYFNFEIFGYITDNNFNFILFNFKYYII